MLLFLDRFVLLGVCVVVCFFCGCYMMLGICVGCVYVVCGCRFVRRLMSVVCDGR